MHRHAVSIIARRAISQCSVTGTPIASSSRIAFPQSIAAQPFSRTFLSSHRSWSHGESDSALSSKLASELTYEQEVADSNKEPSFLSEFLSHGIWSIDDKAGADEVSLKRKFGNEEIKILFSIADIDNAPDSSGGSASEDEEGEAEISAESGLNTAEAEAEAEANAADDQDQSLPIRCAITISKGKSQGALTIDAVVEDGMFLVDNISLYPDEKLALDLTSEADWKRRGMYMGPAFDHLDDTLQTEFESFLEERGIDSNLALFIPDLAEHKEQKEYTKWLEGVKKFIDA